MEEDHVRITAIKPLERSVGGPRMFLAFDGGPYTCEATQLYTFANGLTLFLLENYSVDESNMLLADRDGHVHLAVGKPEFTLKPNALRPRVEPSAPPETQC
jgi:hypothetical protein